MIHTVNIVVEDILSEAVLRITISKYLANIEINHCYGKSGYGYIKRNLSGFNNAAKGTPFIVLADLEEECAPLQISAWLQRPIHHNLLCRIAVREVEAWLLADRKGLARFLGINEYVISKEPDKINDPKRHLIDLARKSQKRVLREAIVPRLGSSAKVGPNYNGKLVNFVDDYWNVTEAARNSESLRRAINAIKAFQPV
jgi:hypothetical protein